MKKNKSNVCPGCGRHCSLDAPRCKYGRDYLEKQRAKEAKNGCGPDERRFKWEAFVQREGLVWRLFMVSRRMKKALTGKKSTEEHMLSALSQEEKQALEVMLEKLEARISGE